MVVLRFVLIAAATWLWFANEVQADDAAPVTCSATDNTLANAQACETAGRAAYMRSDYSAAEPFHRRAQEIRSALQGAEHPDTLTALSNLALDIGSQGRYAEAKTLDRRLYDARVRVLGAEHPDTLSALNNLAADISSQGRYAEAETLDRKLYDAQVRVLGAEHPDTLTALNNLAGNIRYQGRYAEAEPLQALAAVGFLNHYGPQQPQTIQFRAALGILRAGPLGRPEQGYPDIKGAADSTWDRMRDTRVAATQSAARQILTDARWIFEGQMSAAWRWGHQP